MRIVLGQDYKTEPPEVFKTSLLTKWKPLTLAAVMLDAQTILMRIYGDLSVFTQSRQNAPTPSLENAATILQMLQAASTIIEALKNHASVEEMNATSSATYTKIFAIVNRLDSWYTPADGALKLYLKDCEMGEIASFSDAVAAEAIKIGNLENPHVTLAVKAWAIQAAYNTTNPNYSALSIVREKYNADGSAKPGVSAPVQTVEEKKAAIIEDFKTFQVDISQGKTPEIAKKLATKTATGNSKIWLVAGAALIGAFFVFKG